MEIDLKEVEAAIKKRLTYKAVIRLDETRVCFTVDAKNITLGNKEFLGVSFSIRDIITGISGDDILLPTTEQKAIEQFKLYMADMPSTVKALNAAARQ